MERKANAEGREHHQGPQVGDGMNATKYQVMPSVTGHLRRRNPRASALSSAGGNGLDPDGYINEVAAGAVGVHVQFIGAEQEERARTDRTRSSSSAGRTQHRVAGGTDPGPARRWRPQHQHVDDQYDGVRRELKQRATSRPGHDAHVVRWRRSVAGAGTARATLAPARQSNKPATEQPCISLATTVADEPQQRGEQKDRHRQIDRPDKYAMASV